MSISFESFIYRAPASKVSFTRAPASKASFTKLRLQKLHLQKLQLQSFTFKASPTMLQCMVYKDRLRTTATSANTWFEFEVSSQQTLLTEDLEDYTMYHILGFHNWAS
ncbi:hypothetical protein ACFX12_002876 [Malus domestica]